MCLLNPFFLCSRGRRFHYEWIQTRSSKESQTCQKETGQQSHLPRRASRSSHVFGPRRVLRTAWVPFVGASGTVGPTSLPEGAETPGRAPSECRVCKKSFPYQSQLTLHQRTHTGERPFQCDICAKVFIQLSYLQVHQQIHTDKKPYSCDLCLKKFTQDSTLCAHKRTHTQEKPFRCEQCESFRPPREPQRSPTHPLWAQALRVPRVSQSLPSARDFQTPLENPFQMTGSGPCPQVQVPSAPRKKFGIICHLCDTMKG